MPRETRSGTPSPARFGDRATGSRSSVNGIFRKEGEYWTVGYGGKSFRLKDTKGLGYLAHLLRHPAVEFHVLDLAGGIAGQRDDDEAGHSARALPRGEEDLEQAGIHIGSLGDAGEMLDEQAKAAYRRRLSDLREDLEEAKERGNVERAEQAEQEIDALTRELSRAVGLGGRDRRAVSASERARQSIAKTIKSVLDRIAQSDAALGDLLSRCIRTGSFCSYQPDPDFPIAWEFAATTTEPAGYPGDAGEPAHAGADLPKSQPVVPEVSPFSLAQRTAFVGREHEKGAIRAAIDRGRTGQGSIVMLYDGPGVGKTRLAMEMAQYATRNGFRCSVGRCYERDEPHPYLPFAEIIESNMAQSASLDDYRGQMGPYAAELAQIAPSLRRIFPDLPQMPDLPAAQQRGYLFQSLAESMARAARIRPCMYLLEDLHWADESTLALLTYLARRVAQLPAVIIGTYRSGYSDINPPLVRTLEELIRMGIRPQKLTGLTKDDVEKMLQELSGRQPPANLVSLIFEESQGYPFFVEEVYLHLVEEGKLFDAAGQFRAELELDETDVPENVRLIISRRLERLDESEKRVLTAAAVIGRSFSFRLLTEVSQIEVDELFTVIEKAQRMGIIVPSSEGPETPFTFAHELVRQTLLAEISIVRRQQLHARIAAALESLDPISAKEYAGEISDHLVKAGSFANREALVRWLIDAGNRALEAYAFEEARVSFELVLSRVNEADARPRAEILYSLGVAKRGLGRWSEAHILWERALEIFEALADQEGIARTCLQLAEGAAWSGKQRETFETAERLLAKLSESSKDRALLLAILALGKLDEDEPDAAREVFTAALAVAEKLPDSGVKGAILAFRSKFNFVCLNMREALEDSLRSAELLSPAAAWIRAERLLWYKATLVNLGRMKEADNVDQELEPLASRIGHLPALSSCRRTSAWTEFWRRPDLARLEDKVRGDLDAQTEPGMNPFFMSAAQLSTTQFLSGKWDQALRHAESAWSREAPGHVQAMNVAVRFRVMAYAGDREGALALINVNRDLIARAGKTNIYGSWMLLIAAIEGMYVLGERERAAMLYRDVDELINTGTIFVQMLSRFPRTVAGISAAAAREWNVAEEHFRIGLEQAESFPNQLEQAEIRRFHAMMLIDRAAPGDREKAQTLLSQALESYERIGMSRHVEMTQTLLARRQ
ncbi:MAG: AAA family ATPase [Candidatus Binatus sp.]